MAFRVRNRGDDAVDGDDQKRFAVRAAARRHRRARRQRQHDEQHHHRPENVEERGLVEQRAEDFGDVAGVLQRGRRIEDGQRVDRSERSDLEERHADEIDGDAVQRHRRERDDRRRAASDRGEHERAFAIGAEIG